MLIIPTFMELHSQAPHQVQCKVQMCLISMYQLRVACQEEKSTPKIVSAFLFAVFPLHARALIRNASQGHIVQPHVRYSLPFYESFGVLIKRYISWPVARIEVNSPLCPYRRTHAHRIYEKSSSSK